MGSWAAAAADIVPPVELGSAISIGLASSWVLPANGLFPVVFQAGIPGFYDPVAGEPKSVRVRYKFRGRTHYAEIPDYMPVVLPLKGAFSYPESRLPHGQSRLEFLVLCFGVACMRTVCPPWIAQRDEPISGF